MIQVELWQFLLILESIGKPALVSDFTTDLTYEEDCKAFHKCLESFHQIRSKLS